MTQALAIGGLADMVAAEAAHDLGHRNSVGAISMHSVKRGKNTGNEEVHSYWDYMEPIRLGFLWPPAADATEARRRMNDEKAWRRMKATAKTFDTENEDLRTWVVRHIAHYWIGAWQREKKSAPLEGVLPDGLVVLVAGGFTGAADVLCARVNEMLMKHIAPRIWGGNEYREEALQRFWEKMLERFAKAFIPMGRTEAWLRAKASQVCIQVNREYRRQQMQEVQLPEAELVAHEAMPLQLGSEEKVQQLLKQLTRHERELVILK